MTENDNETLRQALIELEHLRQNEAASRRNAESLLEGLQSLSAAQSQQDGFGSVLAVLRSALNCTHAAIVTMADGGDVWSLAVDAPSLEVRGGQARGALSRAFGGKAAILADAVASGWWRGLNVETYARFGSALLKPVDGADQPAVIVCLATERAAFRRDDLSKLDFFVPLAVHGIRHSAKLAELQDAVDTLEVERRLAETNARRDALTGLSNRMHFDEVAEPLLNLSGDRSGAYVAVDLNAFKPINDSFGHQAGDAVLVEIARRLKEMFDDAEIVARVGGDEFAALLPRATTGADARRIGQRACAVFSAPIAYGHHEFFVGASVGVALLSEVTGPLTEVASAADASMYSIKARRETGFAVYDARIEGGRSRGLQRDPLLRALQNGEFTPYYQPQVALDGNELTGFEALARWRHPEYGTLSPGDFLKRIENAGLIADFTHFMVKTVLGQMADWRAKGLSPPTVSINVSEVNLATENGIGDLVFLLSDHSDLADMVTIEITEDIFIARAADKIRQSIDRLVERGVRISLDDFGTGYGSFRHLRELPFHELKIDAEFVAGIGSERSSEVIIEGFLSIAQGLGASVVAEGVERAEQASFLLDLGCDIAQGYLFGAPCTAAEAEKLLTVDPAGSRKAG